MQQAAGVRCLASPGEPVTAGAPVLELHTCTPAHRHPDAIPAALDALRGALQITADPAPAGAVVPDVLR